MRVRFWWWKGYRGSLDVQDAINRGRRGYRGHQGPTIRCWRMLILHFRGTFTSRNGNRRNSDTRRKSDTFDLRYPSGIGIILEYTLAGFVDILLQVREGNDSWFFLRSIHNREAGGEGGSPSTPAGIE